MKLNTNLLVASAEDLSIRMDLEVEVSVEEMTLAIKNNKDLLDAKSLLREVKEFKECISEIFNPEFVKEIGATIAEAQKEYYKLELESDRHSEESRIRREESNAAAEDRANARAKSKK